MSDNERNSKRAKTAPLVSVICPCYNGERYLNDALECVRLQTHRPLELSFWNDASTDGSMNVFEKARAGLEEAGVKIIVGETELKNKGTGTGMAISLQFIFRNGHNFLNLNHYKKLLALLSS